MELPMPTYTVHDAKTNLSKLIEQAEAGEEVIIARRDKPAVKLVAIPSGEIGRRFGAHKGQFPVTDAFFEPLPEGELAAWEGGRARRDGRKPRRSRP
jgi:prevent-host-death family protein